MQYALRNNALSGLGGNVDCDKSCSVTELIGNKPHYKFIMARRKVQYGPKTTNPAVPFFASTPPD